MCDGDEIKTFALDRISDLEITNNKFIRNAKLHIEEAFDHSFGIMMGDATEPQEIILSFDPFQGQYIKSLPLHKSQTVIVDNEDEFRIKLKLHPTHDFLMEIRSFGEDVEVVEPASLRKQILNSLQRAAKQYK